MNNYPNSKIIDNDVYDPNIYDPNDIHIPNDIYNQNDNTNHYNDKKTNNINGLMNLSNGKNHTNNIGGFLGNLTNEKLMNLANTIDPNTLNGTNLDVNNNINNNYLPRGKNDDNTSLIKSLTKEIINNLKENNMSLYDNSSINSRAKNNILNDNYTNYSLGSVDSINSKLLNKKKKKKDIKDIKDIKESIEDFVTTETNSSSVGYISWFFDECFNYKDFLILFTIYFLLSQEMIKDFFSKYFTSLNPDNEGKVGFQGVIIYGLILSVMYMVIHKFV